MARKSSTYRGARRNLAKVLRRQRGGTLRLHMLGDEGETMVIVGYRAPRGSKTKVYKGGNIPGGMRRRIDRGDFMGSLR